MQIPPIKITNAGDTYFINRATDSTYVEKKDDVMETTQSDGEENVPIHHEESWTVATSSKKWKVTPFASARKTNTLEKKQWLQDIKLHNPFSALPEEAATGPTESPTNRIPKPPPIYIDAKIVDPLIELLNNTAGKDNYVIKQIKIDQVKVQTNTPETFRKVTRSLKDKNEAYHTYQLKTDKSYKTVIRGLHPKANTDKISEELAKIGHQVRSINNINKYDTKQPLPLFLVELEPRNNNTDIYDIEKLLNTIVKVEPPRHKKDIPQCIRCQQYGHTKSYCNRIPACVKCVKNHLTIDCPSTGKIEEVRCYNCNGKHPASYKGCEARKQLQRKLFPPLRSTTITNIQAQQDSTKPEIIPNTISTNTIGSLSYAQVTSQSTHTDNQYHNNSNNDTAGIKELLKQSIKNTEMLTRMISEQNAVLKQQTQQITVMLQLITNLLSKK